MRDGSGEREYRFIREDWDRHGNLRIYYVRGEAKARLREQPGTAAFDDEYAQARDGLTGAKPKPVLPNTLRWLVEQYCKSPEFKRLEENTRKVRRGILDGICNSKGAMSTCRGERRYAQMQVQNVTEIRNEKQDVPEAANARVKALRALFTWAMLPEYRHHDANPAAGVSYLPPKRQGGFHTWTDEEVAMYEARHPVGTMARLALDIFLYTGVRRSDAIRMGRQMERDGKLHFTEFKGRNKTPKDRILRILPELRASIDATPSDNLNYLVTSFGQPFTSNGFGNWFKKRCVEAGIPQCSAHGIRKNRATSMINDGASDRSTMAVFGWKTERQVGVYVRNANMDRLADESIDMLAQKRNVGVPLFGAVAAGGTKRGKK